MIAGELRLATRRNGAAIMSVAPGGEYPLVGVTQDGVVLFPAALDSMTLYDEQGRTLVVRRLTEA